MQLHWLNTHETGPDSGNWYFGVWGNVSDLFALGLSEELNIYANQSLMQWFSKHGPSPGASASPMC